MACVNNMSANNAMVELEEGEIVDDYLSDISSEEEYLMRQRLKVLENYNNILERKKQRTTSTKSGKIEDSLSHDLSEISATELEDTFRNEATEINTGIQKEGRHSKNHKQRRKEVDFQDKHKVYQTEKVRERKKVHRKKKSEVKVISESSDESDAESRIKRQRLSEAVSVHKAKSDPTSLQARIQRMLSVKELNPVKPSIITETEIDIAPENSINENILNLLNDDHQMADTLNDKLNQNDNFQLVDLCADDDSVNACDIGKDTVDSAIKENTENNNTKSGNKDSDDDLESLRQNALKTKASKSKPEQISNSLTETEKPLLLSDDEDAAELRLICLKSALLKKAIEMKQKQKMKKKLNKSFNLKDDLLEAQEELMNRIESDNNTDIESVDMDIGSDGDEKTKDCDTKTELIRNDNETVGSNKIQVKKKQSANVTKEDELEEDEDLLRAKLLTSLTKNLPNLVDPSKLASIEADNAKNTPSASRKPSSARAKPKISAPQEIKLVINVRDSDSEGENEATKNLTKMHTMLSEPQDFEHKLEVFLKSARMEVEKTKLPDVVQNPEPVKTKSPLPTEAQMPVPSETQNLVSKKAPIVPMNVNNIPEAEQMEYKKLVRRLAELEKLKARQPPAPALVDKPQPKDTLKPRNIVNSPKFNAIINLEEQIAFSRKNIAQESAKMMKLKEEETNLSQKYTIVHTELKNLSTAIVFNRKQQRMVQNHLSKIRLNHQRLLQSTNLKHSKINGQMVNNKITSTTKLQKENNPTKEICKNITRTITNELITEEPIQRLSVRLDICNKRKTVILRPEEPLLDDCNEVSRDTNSIDHRLMGNLDGHSNIYDSSRNKDDEIENDYESPLTAFGNANWDPNAILCKFEIGGRCKDPDCKYFHPNPKIQ